MKKVISTLTMAATLALGSCITDTTINGENCPGGESRPSVLSFQPRMDGQDAAATRAETYDETYEEFAAFFTGVGDDILEGSGPDDPARATGRKADRKIATFRVLVFHGAGSTLGTAGELVSYGGQKANHLFDWLEEGDPGYNPADGKKPPFSFELLTGKYDFVFVANDQGLFGAGGASTNCATLAELKSQLFTRDRVEGSKNIPMVSWFEGVEVGVGSVEFVDTYGRYDTKVPGKTVKRTGTWDVPMERAAIRLSFGFRMGAEQFEAWKRFHGGGTPMLYIDGLRGGEKVFPFDSYADAGNGDATHNLATQQIPAYDLASATTAEALRMGKLMQNSDGSWEVFFDRLIYPEHIPADKTSPQTALRAYMNLDYGDELVVKEIGVHRPFAPGAEDYSLRRNSWVWVKAKIFTDIDYEVRVVPWGGAGLDPTAFTQWNLTTDRSQFLFRAPAGTSGMEVFTDHPAGWTIDPLAAADNWITLSATTGQTGLETLVTVGAGANTTSQVRSATVTLRAGNLSRKIVVTQLPASGNIVDTTPDNVFTYVGAFWKANQYGERLIRVIRPEWDDVTSIDGPWAAYVVEGEEWIVLDTREPASTVTWMADPARNGNDPGFDATHRVQGYATSVSGEVAAEEGSSIYFRIGLNGPYAPTAEKPARYGMVLLVFGGSSPKYQRIWIRQGEGADYIFEPGDTGTDGAAYPENRKFARRWSPYNLTTSGLTDAVEFYQIPEARGGEWVAYPTMAGGLFQFNQPTPGYERRAYHPGQPAVITAGEYLVTHNPSSAVWNESIWETCPPGYRRPKTTYMGDGSNPEIEAAILVREGNEFAQSFFKSATEDASAYARGYYADGWFDRREIISDTRVATPTRDVAVYGILMYNPVATSGHYNASVFIPYAGRRLGHNPNGEISELQGYGPHLWTSTPAPSPNGFDLNAGYVNYSYMTGSRPLSGEPTLFFTSTTHAFSIRCVESDDNVTEGFSVSQPPAFTHSGQTLPVTITSTDSHGFAVAWEVAGYDADNNGTFAMSEKPEWLSMPTKGDGGLPTQTINVSTQASVTPLNNNLAMRTPAPLGTPAAPWDLSTAGGTSPRNTANCYIINGPGSYKLPLVYGNAIRDGADNTPAYKNTGGTLDNFINHAGNPISSPYVNEHATPADAIVVWMDSPGLITNPRLTGSGQYQSLAFEVARETIAQGNAVVAVRDASGVILWSWHIWAAHPDKAFDVSTPANNVFEIEGGSGVIYKVMKTNIGWVSNTGREHPARKVTVKLRQSGSGKTATFTVNQSAGADDLTLGRSPYFQWGRKDPMPPAKTNNNNDEITLSGSRIWTNTNVVSGSIPNAIKNPNITYGGGSRWHGESYHNLWSATMTLNASASAVADMTTNVKTIYDPSPAGFRVPVMDVFSGLTDTNFEFQAGLIDGYNGGRHESVPSLAFPATGHRSATASALSNVGTDAYHWVAFQLDIDTAPYFHFDIDGVSSSYNTGLGKSTSQSIRPVADADPDPNLPTMDVFLFE
jgi:hypothetical protein